MQAYLGVNTVCRISELILSDMRKIWGSMAQSYASGDIFISSSMWNTGNYIIDRVSIRRSFPSNRMGMAEAEFSHESNCPLSFLHGTRPIHVSRRDLSCLEEPMPFQLSSGTPRYQQHIVYVVLLPHSRAPILCANCLCKFTSLYTLVVLSVFFLNSCDVLSTFSSTVPTRNAS